MADHLTIARPYAKAIFNQAVKDSHLEQWSLVLQSLARVTTHSKIAALYGNPKVTSHTMQGLIDEVLKDILAQDVVTKLGDQLKNFLSLLLEEKRLLMVKDINLLYHDLLANYKNIIEIQLISAMPLNEDQQNAFYRSLEKRFGSKVSIEFQEDKSLIGGALIRSGNWVLDGSIRGKLARLDERLMS